MDHAELLVLVVTNPTIDAVKSGRGHQRGDVIAVQAAGQLWGSKDLSSPKFRVVSISDMTVAEAQVLLQGFEVPDLKLRDKPMRAFAFDLDSVTELTTADRNKFDSTKNRDKVTLTKAKANAITIGRVI